MENFRIESLEINKIGAFEHIKMDFPKKTDPDKAEIHILTGENGTGKSTVLEVLAHSIFPMNEPIESQRTKHLFLKIPTLNGCNYEIFNNFSESTKFSGELEALKKMKTTSFHNYYLKTQQDYKVTKFDYAFFAYSGYRKIDEYNQLDIAKALDINPFENALDFSKSTNTDFLLRWIGNCIMRFLNASSQTGNEIETLKIAQPIMKIRQVIEEIIEKPVLFKLVDNNDNLQVVINIDGISQHFNAIPDGVRSIISWVGDLIMRLYRIQWNEDTDIFDRNFILFLDEIEVHLHPAWQRKILPVVQKLFKNAQIFISTHSPFVVGSVDGAWVHKLKKEGAYAVLDGEPVLSEDAESYDTILEEIFGVKERFGVRVEEDLKRFYQFKSQILNDEDYDMDSFLNLVSKLASESIELESMLGMELKQIKRLTGKDFLATV